MKTRIVMTAAVTALVAAVAAAATWSRSGESHGDAAPGSGIGLKSADAEPLPAPRGAPVLRVRGVAHGNSGARVTKIDFATVDRLARERVTVHEPFLKRDVTFTVVRMDELLRRAGVGPSARSLYLHALDDYHVELPIAAVASQGLLATRADGKPIAIAKGGPIRLVFPSGAELAANTDNWIWSVDSMRVLR